MQLSRSLFQKCSGYVTSEGVRVVLTELVWHANGWRRMNEVSNRNVKAKGFVRMFEYDDICFVGNIC
jgi:hypothetical protein